MKGSRFAFAAVLLAVASRLPAALSQDNPFVQFTVSGTYLNSGSLPLSGWFVVNENNGTVLRADPFHGSTELSTGLSSRQGSINSFWLWVTDKNNDTLNLGVVAPGNGGSLAGYAGGPVCSALFGIGTECGYSDSSFFDGQMNSYYGEDQVYVGSVLESGPVPMVKIAIKPHGNGPAHIDPRSHLLGMIAILSDRQFDAVTDVDTNSLTFGPTGTEQSIVTCDKDGRDLNKDGLPDLICHFNPRLTQFLPSESLGILIGKTIQGSPFVGTEKVMIRPAGE